MENITRFQVFDRPPSSKYQFYPNSKFYTPYADYKPVYQGELRGVIGWNIEEEINTISQSATITIAPSTITQQDEFDTIYLTAKGKFVTTGGSRIVVSKVKTSRVEDTSFLDTVIDYGTFIKVESFRGRDTPKTIFWGMVQDYETDSKSQNVILRLVSIGFMAMQEIAQDYLLRRSQLTTITPDGTTVGDIVEGIDSTGLSNVAYDRIRVFFQDPVRVMYYLIYRNPFIQHGVVIDADGGTSSWQNPDGLGGQYSVDMIIEGNTVGDVLEKCMLYLPPQWFLETEYIETNASGNANPDIALKINLRQSKTRGTQTATSLSTDYVASYYLHNGREVVEYDLNLSGSNVVQDIRYSSATQGELLLTKGIGTQDMPDPAFDDPMPLQYIPQYRDVTDDDGNVIGQEITEQSRYIKRITARGGGTVVSTVNSMGETVHLPSVNNFRDKTNRVRDVWWSKPVFKVHSATRPVDDARIRPNQTKILNALALQEQFANFSPKKSGKVVVIDVDNRKIDEYSLGDVIGFRHFDHIIDYAEVRIVGRNISQHQAILTVDHVLPTTTRRIQSLINDLRNANDI